MIVWLIGLSGVGKTTVGQRVAEAIRKKGIACLLLDGDEVRDALFTKDRYTLEDREVNSRRLVNLSLLIERNQILVIGCVLSIFPEHRRNLRKRAQGYLEVYLQADIRALQANDCKGVYTSIGNSKSKNVVGLDILFPEPQDSDLVLHNDMNEKSLKTMSAKIVRLILSKRLAGKE